MIDSVSVSHLTSTDATLEAQIDTEGLSTSYQFLLSAICGGKGACLVVVNYPLPSGLLLGSFVDQSVSLDLNTAGVTLQPGGTYTYSVSATNARARQQVLLIISPHPKTWFSRSAPPPRPCPAPASPPAPVPTAPVSPPLGSLLVLIDTGRPRLLASGCGKTTKLEPFEKAPEALKGIEAL